MMPYRSWKKEEEQELLTWRQSNPNGEWQTIGTRLRRQPSACASRYYQMTGSKYAHVPVKTAREITRESLGAKAFDEREAMDQLRVRRIEECEASGVLTPVLLNDPLPGRSALDRKRLNAARPVRSYDPPRDIMNGIRAALRGAHR